MDILLSTFIIICLAAILLYIVLEEGISGIKMMLLGINITIFGGILVIDPNSFLRGIGYCTAIVGLIISLIGLGRNSEK